MAPGGLLADVPPPDVQHIALRVTPAAERMLRAGHPWLFDRAIREQSREGQPGDLAVVFDRRQRFLAVGLYDPQSPIRVRVLQHLEPASIGQAWFRQRLQEAAAVGGGFILSTGDQCGRDTPDENIFRLVETVRRYGRY